MHSHLPSSTTLSTGFLAKPCKATPSGVKVGADVHVSDITYSYDVVLLNNSNMDVQGLLETINHHTPVVDILIDTSKTKVMSLLTHMEQLQSALLGGEKLEVVEKLKYISLTLITKGQGSEEITRAE